MKELIIILAEWLIKKSGYKCIILKNENCNTTVYGDHLMLYHFDILNYCKRVEK